MKINYNSQVSALGLFGILSAYNSVLMRAYMHAVLCIHVCVIGVGEDFAMPLAVKERQAGCHQQNLAFQLTLNLQTSMDFD